MRIKEACKLTGLTDKAIRVYINFGLISPSYTENYAGRKNYSFDDNDIELLKKISLLRKYDFSLNEIKLLLTNESSVNEILETRIAEIRNITTQSTADLNALLEASMKNCKSADELCLALGEAQSINEIKESDEVFDIKDLLKPYFKKAKSLAPKFIFLLLLAFIIGVVITGLIIFACVKLFMNL